MRSAIESKYDFDVYDQCNPEKIESAVYVIDIFNGWRPVALNRFYKIVRTFSTIETSEILEFCMKQKWIVHSGRNKHEYKRPEGYPMSRDNSFWLMKAENNAENWIVIGEIKENCIESVNLLFSA